MRTWFQPVHLLKNAAHVAAANVAHSLVMDSAANVASSTAAGGWQCAPGHGELRL